jgi:hypothetical protein
LSGVSEIQLLEESLREKCIYKVISEDKTDDVNFHKWFEYVLNYIDECNTVSRFDAKCSDRVMKDYDINAGKVN